MTTFKQHLQKSSKLSKRAVLNIEKDIRTFGEFLTAFPDISTAIKNYAMDNDWYPEIFARLKSLRISDSFVQGDLPRSNASQTKMNALYNCVLVNVASDKNNRINDLKFMNDHLEFNNVIIKLNEIGFIVINKSNSDTGVALREPSFRVTQICDTIHDNLYEYSQFIQMTVKGLPVRGINGMSIDSIKSLSGWAIFE